MMKGFFKFLLATLTLGAVFFLGLFLWEEKEKSKIPIFQEEPESHERRKSPRSQYSRKSP